MREPPGSIQGLLELPSAQRHAPLGHTRVPGVLGEHEPHSPGAAAAICKPAVQHGRASPALNPSPSPGVTSVSFHGRGSGESASIIEQG